MKKSQFILAAILILLLIGGFALITYKGMPIRQTEESQNGDIPSNTQTETTSESAEYSLEEVTTHNTKADCWTAINGEVYDLSSWVSRHPGGAETIIRLCGTNGSTAFTRQHGRSNAAQKSLTLLKIGILKSS